MWEALEGCRLKFNAGIAHMQRFQHETDRFLEDHPDLVVFSGQANAQRTKYVHRVERVRRFPTREWGVIIGDAVHCFRSLLDQMTYAFAREPAARTAFPIALTEKEWAINAPAQYWSVMPGFLNLLNRVQPYHREDPAAPPTRHSPRAVEPRQTPRDPLPDADPR